MPKVGAIVIDGMVHANVENPGLTIRYTEDGSDPDVNSKVYEGPIPFKGQVKLRAFSISENGGGISGIK
ncbi:chitobiase/beta-hexosaminidase C-terminal domain-containing protein [Aquiflexum gelatinilyticum]|uniref:Chitobiase/beta-hexosaminidase C-terminal domain-containing protein n=1 Tax=Aquiflexum gelatinilyticum TaxID=2961943 RepID=A0A9X2PB52_9BACT|nr:chitobiase/beta-hexosaminidase C-terminal domain-containing protein [Aquiflexum gelatinilyticum]MCR9015490.1 chitobiase/beta-hexosaminidase C-terminal domain-containing protein [Aquiflexum gelatinilyticum]